MVKTIIFLCLLIAVAISIIGCTGWLRWNKAYWKLYARHNETITENIKLQTTLFRLANDKANNKKEKVGKENGRK